MPSQTQNGTSNSNQDYIACNGYREGSNVGIIGEDMIFCDVLGIALYPGPPPHKRVHGCKDYRANVFMLSLS